MTERERGQDLINQHHHLLLLLLLWPHHTAVVVLPNLLESHHITH